MFSSSAERPEGATRPCGQRCLTESPPKGRLAATRLTLNTALCRHGAERTGSQVVNAPLPRVIG